MKTTTFASIVTQYFSHYLPKQRGLSLNTIKSYRDTMIQLLCFVDKELDISINKIESKIFSTELINTFLDYLVTERNLSISSRNQRLAALHSFFKYLMLHDFECFEACSSILNIEFTRKPNTLMNYLSIEEVKTLLRIPDPKTTKGLRELCILATLYETAARVQELIDIQLSDVTFETPSVVLLHGKGNKERLIPISNDVSAIISMYCKVYDIQLSDNLFQNIQGDKLTRNGVRYIVNKNIKLAKSIHPELFSGKISNHTFRHSKSMHLLEAGVNLIYIRDFLGHTSVSTTEIYAKTNSEIKRKAIEQHSLSLKNKTKYNVEEKEVLLEWLKKEL